MINNTEHLIEQYTLGNLSSQEAKNFEQYLSKNPDVQQKVDMQKDVVEAIKQKGRLQMKANLAQINPKVSSQLTQRIAIAAATIATATIVGFGIYTTTKKEQIVKQPVISSESIAKHQSEKSTIEVENITSETELLVVNETSNSEKVTLETEKNISISTPATSSTYKKEIVTASSLENKPKTTPFDPTAEELGDSDEHVMGTDNGLEKDPSLSEDTREVPTPEILKNSKVQGFTYNGKSIGISGTYKTAYTVTQRQGMLIFEYDNKFYEIIECEKIEKWEDHEITDPKILKKL